MERIKVSADKLFSDDIDTSVKKTEKKKGCKKTKTKKINN